MPIQPGKVKGYYCIPDADITSGAQSMLPGKKEKIHLDNLGSAINPYLSDVPVGRVYYVDPNSGANTNTGLTQDAALATVGEALSRCRAQMGDTIAIMPSNAWQYHRIADGRLLPVNEEIIITTPGVNIVGCNYSSSLGVVWTPVQEGGTCIIVRALDVTISGICFYEGSFTGYRGIFAEWDGITAFGDNMSVYGCYFEDATIGIQLDYSWYNNIANNHFTDCTRAIYTDPADSGTLGNKIVGNYFYADTGYAMSLQECDESLIAHNHVYSSDCAHGSAATGRGIDLASGNDNMVADNWLSCILPAASNGDYDDFCTAGTDDAWINNHLMDGDAVDNPS